MLAEVLPGLSDLLPDGVLLDLEVHLLLMGIAVAAEVEASTAHTAEELALVLMCGHVHRQGCLVRVPLRADVALELHFLGHVGAQDVGSGVLDHGAAL